MLSQKTVPLICHGHSWGGKSKQKTAMVFLYVLCTYGSGTATDHFRFNEEGGVGEGGRVKDIYCSSQVHIALDLGHVGGGGEGVRSTGKSAN